MTVDTACSSSLVALHLARGRRCGRESARSALAGGVTVMATPSTFAEFARKRGLAADGRARRTRGRPTAPGWGEGVGVLVVERALGRPQNGHRVLAVVAGTAVATRTAHPTGLTAAKRTRIAAVIRTALDSAG